MKSTFIYALCEPGTRTVRYIGKANDPSFRFKQHLRQSSRAKTHLGNWLRSILCVGGKPELVVLREVPEGHRGVAEERYIRLARGLGMKLVNGTDGGDGLHNPTPEIREKIAAGNRGKMVSDESRAKMSAAQQAIREQMSALNSGSNNPMFGRVGDKNPMFGETHSPEARAKISATHKGKPKSAEHNEANSQAQRGIPKTPEHNAKNSAAQKLIWAARKAAKAAQV